MSSYLFHPVLIILTIFNNNIVSGQVALHGKCPVIPPFNYLDVNRVSITIKIRFFLQKTFHFPVCWRLVWTGKILFSSTNNWKMYFCKLFTKSRWKFSNHDTTQRICVNQINVIFIFSFNFFISIFLTQIWKENSSTRNYNIFRRSNSRDTSTSDWKYAVNSRAIATIHTTTTT